MRHGKMRTAAARVHQAGVRAPVGQIGLLGDRKRVGFGSQPDRRSDAVAEHVDDARAADAGVRFDTP